MIFEPLYKRAVNGKINKWTVEVNSNCFRTISGYHDGVQTTSEWTCCEGKNTGKKNATTPEEQAKAEAEAMYRKRKEMGFFPDIKDCDKKVFYQPMLAHKWEDHKDKIQYPVISQPKLDGVRCIIKSDGMWSRNGKEIISAPHIFESLLPHFESEPDLILDGELYADKNVADFNTIISCVRKTKPTLQDLQLSIKYIKYHIYDVPSNDGTYGSRMVDMADLILPDTCVLVPTFHLESEEDVNNKLKEYLEQGYEGQMIRLYGHKYENKRSKSLLKHKTFVEDEFEIIDVIEGKGNLSGKVGKLTFKLPDGQTFDSAVNGGWEYLEELFKRNDLIGKKATVKFFEYTEYGIPRFPKVIEIRDYEG